MLTFGQGGDGTTVARWMDDDESKVRSMNEI